MRIMLGALVMLCFVAAGTQAGDAVILRSTDFGQSWTQDPVDCPENLNGVWVSAEDEILAVGDNGTILRNPTGDPNDWQAVDSPTSEDLMAVDGGWNWSYIQTAWAVGDNGTIIYTDNGGCSWQLMNSCTSQDLTDVFKGCGNVWACGSNGTIIRTDELEDDWQFEQTPTGNKLYAIDLFRNGSAELAVGQGGTILQFTSSWQSIVSGTIDHLLGVTDFSYYAGDYAVVVGTRGTILRCDAQFNWEPAASGTSSHLYSVSEALDGTGYPTVAVGNNGTILRSVDKGETWYTVSSPSSQNLRSVAFPHVPGLGIIVGEAPLGGGIIPGTYSGADAEMQDCRVSFSSGAFGSIRVTIDGAAPSVPVDVTVFDLSGRKIGSCQQIDLSSGSAMLPVRGSGLANGVYLVLLEAEDLRAAGNAVIAD